MNIVYIIVFLGMFAKLIKVTISFVMSVCQLTFPHFLIEKTTRQFVFFPWHCH